jgi:hypothetical protein
MAIRVPIAVERVRLTPDAIAYYNIGQNLACGHGFVSTLQLHCLGATCVKHSAMSDWPPAYPAFAGLAIGCGGGEKALQFASALFVSLAAGLVFLIGTRLFEPRVGLLAGCAAVLAPNLLYAGCMPLSDSLGLMLALGALAAALTLRPTAATCWAAAALAVAAVLTRYPNAVVGLPLLGWALMRQETRRCAAICAGVGCSAALLGWQLLRLGVPLEQIPLIHYGVESFGGALWRSDTAIDPLYAVHHVESVGPAILRNALVYGIDLLAGPRGLFLLSTGLVAAAVGRAGAALSQERKLVLWVALLNFSVYALTWSISPVKGSRFMLLSYCLLLPFCAHGLLRMMSARMPWRWTAIGVCSITAGVYVWGCVTAASYTGGECTPLPGAVSQAVVQSLPSGANLASNNPWVLSYSTGAPTALLPRDMDPKRLAKYVRDLNIGRIVLVGKQPGSRTARSVMSRYGLQAIRPGVRIAATDQGQKAYEGKWKMMPQIVQKLPSTHSPSMTPRKNGSERL